MRGIDERGRLFGVINVIDLAALLVLVVFVTKFAYPRVAASRGGVTEKEIQVVFLVTKVRFATASVIRPGDEVREVKSNLFLGRVVDVVVKPMPTEVETADGRVVLADSPVYKDVWITVSGPGRISPNAIILGSQEIRIGTKVNLKTNLYAVESTVMEIRTDLP